MVSESPSTHRPPTLRRDIMQFKPQPPTKSSYTAGGQCAKVEITDDAVYVTNSRGDGPFTHDEWEAFGRGVLNGEFGFDQLP